MCTWWPYQPLPHLEASGKPACISNVCIRVCHCASVSAYVQTSRSVEVQLVMALLCLVGTAATVTFTNAMNQRQRGQAGRPKNNQLYSSQIDTGWTGQRERWRRTEHTPRTNKQERMRARTDSGPSGLMLWYGGSEGPYLCIKDLLKGTNKRGKFSNIIFTNE